MFLLSTKQKMYVLHMPHHTYVSMWSLCYVSVYISMCYINVVTMLCISVYINVLYQCGHYIMYQCIYQCAISMWSLFCIIITWLISTISVVGLHLATNLIILRGEDVTRYTIHYNTVCI